MKEFCKDLAKGAANGGAIGLLTGAAGGAVGLLQVCSEITQIPGGCDVIEGALHAQASGAGAGVGLAVGAVVGGITYASSQLFFSWCSGRKSGNSSTPSSDRRASQNMTV